MQQAKCSDSIRDYADFLHHSVVLMFQHMAVEHEFADLCTAESHPELGLTGRARHAADIVGGGGTLTVSSNGAFERIETSDADVAEMDLVDVERMDIRASSSGSSIPR